MDCAHEEWHDGGVLRVRVLSGAEYIEVPQRHCLELIDAEEADAETLRCKFCDCIG